MKYWRGYITAAILAALTLGITAFAESHAKLIDMVYPYVTRLLQTALAQWSSGATFCLWQLLAIMLVVGLLASIVVMIVLKWNVAQWLGWVLAAVSCLWLLHTGMYGLNNYAGPLAEDIRLNVTEYTITELANATTYYRDQANALAQEIPRDENGKPIFPEFEELALMAGDGYDTLTYDQSYPVFAGSRVPVKKLGWSGMYSSMGIAGITIPFTGEAAVNPDLPGVIMPFTMCHEMAHRICIASERDANFAAFLACTANESPIFQYSGYFMALRYCYNALASQNTSTADKAANQIYEGISDLVLADMEDYRQHLEATQKEAATALANTANDAYIKISGDNSGISAYGEVCDLLTSWHIQTIYLPDHKEEDTSFNPMDKNQVDLTTSTTEGN